MQSRLPDGIKVILDKAVRITHVETTIEAWNSIVGLSRRPVVVDWDRRCVFVERKEGRWIWIPFEHIAWTESDCLPAPMDGSEPAIPNSYEERADAAGRLATAPHVPQGPKRGRKAVAA